MKKIVVLLLFFIMLLVTTISTANPNKKLFKAIRADDIIKIKKAIDDGADVNSKDPLGDTPLIVSIDFFYHSKFDQKLEIVKLLIEKGAKINYKSSGNRAYTALTPLEAIIRKMNKRTSYIETHTRSKKVDKIYVNGLKIVKFLLKKGAAIGRNKGELLGNTITHGRADLVKVLIKYGGKIKKGKNQTTALHLAAVSLYQPVEKINILIKNGININVANADGKTPLLEVLSSQSRREASIKCLIDNGANVNVKDKKSNTPLIYAIKTICPLEILLSLIKSGAKVNDINRIGETPLQVAKERRYMVLKKIQINKKQNSGQQKEKLKEELKILDEIGIILLTKKAIMGKESPFNIKDFEKAVTSRNYKHIYEYFDKKIVFIDYLINKFGFDSSIITRKQALLKIKKYSKWSMKLKGIWHDGIKFKSVIKKRPSHNITMDIGFGFFKDTSGRLWIKKFDFSYIFSPY
jgi:ankyrin repeat protein